MMYCHTFIVEVLCDFKVSVYNVVLIGTSIISCVVLGLESGTSFHYLRRSRKKRLMNCLLRPIEVLSLIATYFYLLLRNKRKTLNVKLLSNDF